MRHLRVTNPEAVTQEQRIKRVLNADVRCGNLRKLRAPWAYVHGFGFVAGDKTYYCLMRGPSGKDWTHEMLLDYIQEEGEKQAERMAKMGIVPTKPPDKIHIVQVPEPPTIDMFSI